MKITGQKEIINAVLEALDTSSIGIGIKERYNIKKSNDQVNYSLTFQLKEDKEANETDYFWLGWVSNQYY
ncbi:hypothetical protein HXZ94_15640 [Empedobacter falsenii]|uniref:hypothetical protein n=1 Tax=Empedobacter falsenii TaxID=343874 RepID=UPI002577C6A5|nr:hypothetical protein [Empedobacter falsenii]MDM1299928.1 hypothetical protein [Empedobacter falsenii]MDM1319721.1 hypothetical protein [Empedobacter falsenii]